MSENERVDVAAPGTWEALTLLGLMRSRTEYRPVGPTDEFTLEAMRDLAALDLIEVPWPSLHWPENVTGDHTTYERFGWRLAVPRASEGIIALLEAALLESQTDPGRSSQWVKIWQRLAAAESIGFLGHQLDQLSMPWQWRQDATALLTAMATCRPVSEIRYSVWAAARAGSAAFMRTRGDERQVRDVIVRELIQRPLLAKRGNWELKGFQPKQKEPFSLVGGAFASMTFADPMSYWTRTPSVAALADGGVRPE